MLPLIFREGYEAVEEGLRKRLNPL